MNTMKTSPLIALSAFLFQAQACVRVRVDRYINNEGLSVIQDVKLYDNGSPVKTAAGPHQFTMPFPETVKVDDYYVQLQYKDGKHHPLGGRIQYPKGPDRDLQGKAWSTYVDGDGRTHDVYCFSDNYDNCGAYQCGV